MGDVPPLTLVFVLVEKKVCPSLVLTPFAAEDIFITYVVVLFPDKCMAVAEYRLQDTNESNTTMDLYFMVMSFYFVMYM